MGCIQAKPNYFSYAKNGQTTELIQEILRFPESINDRDVTGNIAIHVACEYNKAESVKILIENGADKELYSEKVSGLTPLQVCAQYGSLECAAVLLDMGADINKQDPYGWTALHFACDKKQFAICELLVNRGANVSITTVSKDTALHFAAKAGVVETAKLLLSKGANINAMDKEVWTPLHTACKWNRVEMALFLARSGADIRALDEVNAYSFTIMLINCLLIVYSSIEQSDNSPLEYAASAQLKDRIVVRHFMRIFQLPILYT